MGPFSNSVPRIANFMALVDTRQPCEAVLRVGT